MRKLLFYLHLYLALVAGIFIVILGVTGSIMAFEPELDHLLHSNLWHVKPGGQTLRLADIGASVSRQFPGEAIGGYTLSSAPDLAYQVNLRRGTVFVNPYTAEIIGVRPPGPDFLARVHQLHLRLAVNGPLPADAGKPIIGAAGIIILILSLSGLYLWWPLKRFTIKSDAVGRPLWFDAHNAIGILSLLFLLALSLTGVMIAFDDTTIPLMYKVTGSKPAETPKTPPPPPGAMPIGVDRAMELAAAALPGATPFAVNVPGPKAAYLVRSHFPEDLTPGGRSRVIVDQYTGKVLFAEGSRTAPTGTRMVIINRAIHTGDIYGIPSKTLGSLASLALVAQIVSGVTMWWKKPRSRS
jgi:uncharacterized iron-regulated membrane protein